MPDGVDLADRQANGMNGPGGETGRQGGQDAGDRGPIQEEWDRILDRRTGAGNGSGDPAPVVAGRTAEVPPIAVHQPNVRPHANIGDERHGRGNDHRQTHGDENPLLVPGNFADDLQGIGARTHQEQLDITRPTEPQPQSGRPLNSQKLGAAEAGHQRPRRVGRAHPRHAGLREDPRDPEHEPQRKDHEQNGPVQVEAKGAHEHDETPHPYQREDHGPSL